MKVSNFLWLFVFCLCIASCNQEEDINPINALGDANNEFAFNFLQEINEAETTEDNYMVSPLSASLALSMVYNGANGQTAEEFEDILGYNGFTPAEINDINRSIIDGLTNGNGNSTFDIANSIWYDEGFPVKQDFIGVNQAHYDAEVQALDFAAPASLEIINGWVSDNTQGKIPTILDVIPADAVMYLINALYFKSTWQYEFDPTANEMKNFYDENATLIGQKEMMVQQADFQYYEHDDLFTSTMLPYKDGGFTMTLFKPQEGKTTTNIIDAMNSSAWNEWKSNYETKDVVITMPKFKLEYKNRLNDELLSMGLQDAFSGASANFTGISDAAQLFISSVLQKTFIDVNEEGTEAAAVTAAVEVTTTSVDPNAPVIIPFTLDQPFVFMITDKATNSICFTGKIGNPEY